METEHLLGPYVQVPSTEHIRAKRIRYLVAGVIAIGLSSLIVTIAVLGFNQRNGGNKNKHSEAIDWRTCHDGAYQCASFSVPLDHADASGPQILLSLMKLDAANSSAPPLGSILVNPGGPGGSGIEFVTRKGRHLSSIAGDRYDIIGFDPRGVGKSQAISCFPSGAERRLFDAGIRQCDVTQEGSFERCSAMAQARWAACRKNAGDILEHVSTAAVSRDMDAIRVALGQETLNYWGFSYGTILGAQYTQMFPDKVGKFVVDGVADPVAWQEGWGFGLDPSDPDARPPYTKHTEDAAREFGRACEAAGPERCALAPSEDNTMLAGNANVYARMRKLVAKLNLQPLAVTDSDVVGIIDGDNLEVVLFTALYVPTLWPTFATAFAELEQGNGTRYRNLISPQPDDICPLVDIDDEGVARDAVVNSDKPLELLSLPNLKRTSHFLLEHYGALTQLGYASQTISSAFWPVVTAERYSGSYDAWTNGTVMIVGTTLDPVTPVESAEKLASLMPNSRMIRHQGVGHSSIAQPSAGCTDRLLRAYWLHGEVPQARITDCVADTVLYPEKPRFRAAGVVDEESERRERDEALEALKAAKRMLAI
ncbi:hypothetical protein HKX48_004204 [Thoreauomyces humboldtii]|nr:hypothetical protein HKX48_004204 [Thoreauomyces humboldtii]